MTGPTRTRWWRCEGDGLRYVSPRCGNGYTHTPIPDPLDEIELLRAENERLRVALVRIVNKDYRGPRPFAIDIAQAALSGSFPEGSE